MTEIQNFVDAIKHEEKIAKEEQDALDAAQKIIDARLAFERHEEQRLRSEQNALARAERLAAAKLADNEGRESDA
jgi:hypothetical protein